MEKPAPCHKPGPCHRDLEVTRRGLLTGAATVAAATVVPRFAAARPGSAPKSHRPYRGAAMRTVQHLVDEMSEYGSYGKKVTDLASYYKTPWLMLIGGRHHRSYRSLGHIRRAFMRDNGDFMTADGLKSDNGAVAELRPYANAWIAMAAQKLGRFDVARPAYAYLRSYLHEEIGGFTVHAPYGEGDDVVGGYVTAHLGLTALYFGELDRARRAGDFLCRLLELQPDIAAGLYLRVDGGGVLITDFPAELEAFHRVKTREPYQLYFLVGYPIGFLAKLYEATGEPKYLDGARAYLDFALSCHNSLLRFHLSHKVAWGAAVVARIAGDETARATALAIVEHLRSIQEHDGRWFPDEKPHVAFDLTAEHALWMIDVSAEIVDPVPR